MILELRESFPAADGIQEECKRDRMLQAMKKRKEEEGKGKAKEPFPPRHAALLLFASASEVRNYLGLSE
jgi:hypothetical protein